MPEMCFQPISSIRQEAIYHIRSLAEELEIFHQEKNAPILNLFYSYLFTYVYVYVYVFMSIDAQCKYKGPHKPTRSPGAEVTGRRHVRATGGKYWSLATTVAKSTWFESLSSS